MDFKKVLPIYLILSLLSFIILMCFANIFGVMGAIIDAFGLPLLIAASLFGSAAAIVLFKKYIHLFD